MSRRTLVEILLAVLLLGGSAFAQFGSHDVLYVVSAPTGACTPGSRLQVVISTGVIYSCQSSVWTALAGGTGISSLSITVPTGLNVSPGSLSSPGTFAITWSGQIPHAQLPTLLSGDIPNNGANTTGTAGGLTYGGTIAGLSDGCLNIASSVVGSTGSPCGSGGGGSIGGSATVGSLPIMVTNTTTIGTSNESESGGILNVATSGGIALTASGGFNASGKIQGGTTVTVPAGLNFSLFLGSDNAFRCQLSAGGLCITPASFGMGLSGTGLNIQTTSVTSSTNGDWATYDGAGNTQDSGLSPGAPGPLGGTTPNTGAFTTLTGTSSLTLGANGGTGGSVVLKGSSSGSSTIQVSSTGALNIGTVANGTWNGSAIGFSYLTISAANIYGLFTSCTGSSGLFLKDGGTCAAPAGSGTVSGQANGVIPLGTSSTAISNQSHMDDGNTTAATITSTEPFAIAGDGTHAGDLEFVGNTANVTIGTNKFAIGGFSVTNATAYGIQFPNTAPSGGQCPSFPTPTSGWSQASWVSCSGAVSSVNTLTGAVVIEAATAGQMAVSGGNGAALTGAADMTYSGHTFSTLTTGIFDWSAATGGPAAFKTPGMTTGTPPTVTTPGTGFPIFGTEGTEPASIGASTDGFVMDSTSHCPIQWNNAANVGCSAALGATETFSAAQTFTGGLNTSAVLDANGHAFIASSATGSAVDSVTITNAATANPATVTVASSGSDSNVNLALNAKGAGIVSSTAYFANDTNRVFMTADWTCGTGGTVSSCVAATIIGSGGGTALTLTLPLLSRSWDWECDLIVGQATAATANNWNMLTATNAPTNVAVYYQQGDSATTFAGGATTGTSSTTTFNIGGTWTLGGTATKMPVRIWGRIEGASASGTVVSLQLVAPTVADLVTIYRGSGCRVR